MPSSEIAKARRLARHQRVRKKVEGTPQRPRLCVFRSLRHIYAQVIDDAAGHTLVAASSEDAEVRKQKSELKKMGVAGLVGTVLSAKAKEKGITQVVFDRGGFRYHGRIKALADAARQGGLVF